MNLLRNIGRSHKRAERLRNRRKNLSTQPPSKPEVGDKVSDDEEVSIETLTSHVEYTFESEQYKNIVNTPKDNILGFMESCHEVIQSLRKSHSALVEENEELKKELELGDKTIMDALAKYSKEGETNE